MTKNKNIIGIIGLGYVGLPLALEFSKKNKVIGFDKNKERIIELIKSKDRNKEVFKNKIRNKKNVKFTSDSANLKGCNIFIVTVPTPVNNKNLPDLEFLKRACEIVAKYIKKNSIFILESTVYPGCTEEFCIPILERISKLKYNKDFYCGYSPERINPSDKKYTLRNIVKITSGSNKQTATKVKNLYKTICNKTYGVKNIRTAEAAKVIENIQRDLNIALVNELSIIFNKINLKTQDVLKAASTKWNFVKYNPGLVGGHCIGVDPYYLTYLSKKYKYNPKVILAGRKLNNSMPNIITTKFISLLKNKKIREKKSTVLVMGITYKENVSDLRNSKALDVISSLIERKIKLDIFEPIVEKKFIYIKNKKILLHKRLPSNKKYDGLLILTQHNVIKKLKKSNLKKILKKNHVMFSSKAFLENNNNF